MASNIIKGSMRNALTRSYAVQATQSAKQQSYALPQNQPAVTKLPSGIIVAAYDNNSPISRVAIFVRSGSRYEDYNNKGVSHMLRLCAGQKTKNFSAFGITRKAQQMGGNIVCESGREYISYEMTTIRENAVEAFGIVTDIVSNSLFRPWEIREQDSRLLTELASRSPTVTVLDFLHTAAFRNTGLGNSLFIPDYKVGRYHGQEHEFFVPDFEIGKISSEELHEFVKQTHTASRMAIVGLGVPHSELVRFGKKLRIEPHSDFVDPPSPYLGGEIRKETGGPLAYVALVGPGAKIGAEEAASFAIAQFILGGQAGTKYGSAASSKLASIIAAAGGTGTAQAINANYSDAGLFGFLLVEEADKAGDVIKAITKGIRSLKIADVDVKNAKAKAKAAILLGTESTEGELEDMGLQAIFTGDYLTPAQVIESIDRVTAASVQSVISNSAKGKLTMASVGSLKTVPYLDQI